MQADVQDCSSWIFYPPFPAASFSVSVFLSLSFSHSYRFSLSPASLSYKFHSAQLMTTNRNKTIPSKVQLAVLINVLNGLFFPASSAYLSGEVSQLVRWYSEPSQPQRIISGLKHTFVKRYIVKRTNKTEIRLEKQSEKAESCREGLWNEIQLKGPVRNRRKNKVKGAGQLGRLVSTT